MLVFRNCCVWYFEILTLPVCFTKLVINVRHTLVYGYGLRDQLFNAIISFFIFKNLYNASSVFPHNFCGLVVGTSNYLTSQSITVLLFVLISTKFSLLVLPLSSTSFDSYKPCLFSAIYFTLIFSRIQTSLLLNTYGTLTSW